MSLPKVLCVDDEPNLLNAIIRGLRKAFDLYTAPGGREGLEVLRQKGPFAVVVSDMRMPEMNGAEFLRQVRQESPETVRLLLTGFAELTTVINAVNEGNIFRFLSKPCTGRELYDAIMDGVRQHELITTERVLLEQTLRGCIRALSELLALAAPAAFGRATRVCQTAMLIGRQVGYRNLWEIEVAAMLAQLAHVTLPPATAQKIYNGESLEPYEEAMIARLPRVTRQILKDIPRLDSITEILDMQDLDFDPEPPQPGQPSGTDIPLGARVMRAANLIDALQMRGNSPRQCLEILRLQKGAIDPDVLEGFAAICDDGALDFNLRGVLLTDLRQGMVLAEDIVTVKGLMLIPADQAITIGLLERIKNYARSSLVQEPVWVRVRTHDVAQEDLQVV